jgi:hypothetical protein
VFASRRSGDQAGATPVYHVHNSGGPDVSTFITAAARIPKDRVEHMLGDQDAGRKSSVRLRLLSLPGRADRQATRHTHRVNKARPKQQRA